MGEGVGGADRRQVGRSVAERAAGCRQDEPCHLAKVFAGEALPDRRVLRIDRPQPSQRAGLRVPRRVDGHDGRLPPGQRHDQVTARHQRLLVGRRDDLARGQRRQRGGQTDQAAGGDKDQVHIITRRQREQWVRPLLPVDAGRQLDRRLIPHGHRSRAEPVGLGKQCRRVATTGEGYDLKALGERAEHLERLPADRTGGTEHRDPPGPGRLPCPSGRHPAPA